MTEMVIPQRNEGEKVLDYARRLKRLGFIPSEVMDASLYGIAKHMEAKEREEQIEDLKQDHKCLECRGTGVKTAIVGQHTENVHCLACQGSGNETWQEADLSPRELELRDMLKSADVHELKLHPDIIHNAFWWFEMKKTKEEDKLKTFFMRVHMVKRRAGYLVVSGFPKAWRSQELIELAKQNKNVNQSDEVPF